MFEIGDIVSLDEFFFRGKENHEEYKHLYGRKAFVQRVGLDGSMVEICWLDDGGCSAWYSESVRLVRRKSKLLDRMKLWKKYL